MTTARVHSPRVHKLVVSSRSDSTDSTDLPLVLQHLQRSQDANKRNHEDTVGDLERVDEDVSGVKHEFQVVTKSLEIVNNQVNTSTEELNKLKERMDSIEPAEAAQGSDAGQPDRSTRRRKAVRGGEVWKLWVESRSPHVDRLGDKLV